MTRRKPNYEAQLAAQLDKIGCWPPVLEYRFHPTRRWRFDLAWENQKLAVEIEGGIWTRGRHTRPVGFQRDMAKYNEAVGLGWRVLRYTPQQVQTWQAAQEIASVILGKGSEDRIMEITRTIAVPTGHILIGVGANGYLEFLSLGDYGKDINLNQHRKVIHTDLMPLTVKWVITISTQYGCSMRCSFCDVPMVGPGKNATFYDLTGQILAALKLHPEITSSKRLNIHFARMGEPTWNPNVLDCAKWLHTHVSKEFTVHPVVSTMMPKNNIWLKTFIHTWMRIKNRLYEGNAGLQLSINSTSQYERVNMFGGNACTLAEIARIMDGIIPVGRKITLNFAIAEYEIDPEKLLLYFDPAIYVCKLTPMHKTVTAIDNGIETHGDYTESYPYEYHEDNLRKAGYDVLTFIASREEDESRITCGNAILSGAGLDGKWRGNLG